MKQCSVVSDDTKFIANGKAGGDGGLVGAAGDDHRQEGAAGESHTVRLLHNGSEAQHFGIHFKGGDGSRCYDNGGEAVEDGLDGDSRVEAGEVKNRIGDGGSIGLERLEYEQEAFVVSRGESGEGSYFLKRLVVFYVGELEGADEGG